MIFPLFFTEFVGTNHKKGNVYYKYQGIVQLEVNQFSGRKIKEAVPKLNHAIRILRNAQDDTLIGNFYFETASLYLIYIQEGIFP